MGNQKTKKLVSHHIVSGLLNSLVLANYENKYAMARLLFDSFHKQYCEKIVWFPLKFPLTSQNNANLYFMSLLSRLYLKLGQTVTKSSLGSTDWNAIKNWSGTPQKFILWQRINFWIKFILSSAVYLIKHGFNECDLFSGLARSRNMIFDLGYLCSPLILVPVWLLTYMRFNKCEVIYSPRGDVQTTGDVHYSQMI